MRTCLYSLSQLDGLDPSGSSRIARQLKFVEHHWKIRDEMGFTDIVFSDNGSSREWLNEFLSFTGGCESTSLAEVAFSGRPIKIYKFEERLEPRSTFSLDDPRHIHDYPYCWRGMAFIKELFAYYDKVIFIDSDCFVLSPRFAKYIRDFSSGWSTIWCPKHRFPDASFQIITKDSVNFHSFSMVPWKNNIGRLMEWALPFNEIRMDFIADRFGEDRCPALPTMDFYGQCPVDIEMQFRHEPK